MNLQMNKFLNNRGFDELNEFRVKETKNDFIRNIKFISTKSLSRATVQDLTLYYDGPKDVSLLRTLLPAFIENHDLSPTITRSTKTTNSSPPNANLVEVSIGNGNLTCQMFHHVLQIAIDTRNIFAMCPYGCEPEEMSKSVLTKLNPMLLHR